MTGKRILTDGMMEEVAKSPRRKPKALDEVPDLAGKKPSMPLAKIREAGKSQRTEFVLYRGPLGVRKIALAHLPVYEAIWRISGAKRLRGEDEGVTPAEIQKELGKKSANATDSLRRNGILRNVTSHVGYQGHRTLFYPTEVGNLMLGLVQMLGYGVMVQIGSSRAGWKARNQTEPENLFRFAELLRGARQPKKGENK